MWKTNWYKKGITHINDLIAENGKFLSQENFETLFNIKTNFIELQGLINAIKDYARKQYGITNFTKKLKMPFIPMNISLLIKSKKGVKIFILSLTEIIINQHHNSSGKMHTI